MEYCGKTFLLCYPCFISVPTVNKEDKFIELSKLEKYIDYMHSKSTDTHWENILYKGLDIIQLFKKYGIT
jgi:hypothetical protein